uniref:CSON012062 protein n=1 Tax=Culicoides sonorensis TaxID=179676 RepID=A0A336M9X8_CULSO
MKPFSPPTSLQAIKDEINEELLIAFKNLNFLQLKLRKIQQLIQTNDDNQNFYYKNDEISSDLKIIKQILGTLNKMNEQAKYNFKCDSIVPAETPYLKYADYPCPNLEPYVPGHIISGVISHIKNAAKGLIYVMDFKRSSVFQSVLRSLNNKENLKLITNPKTLKTGDFIALQIDGQITRVLVDKTFTEFMFFMVDIGEEIPFDKNQHQLFELAKYHKDIPAQALLCKIEGFQNKEDRLTDLLHSDIELEVLYVKNHIIHVKSANSNESSEDKSSSSDSNNTEETNHTNFSSTNPFMSDLMNEMKNVELEAVKEEQEVQDLFEEDQIATSNAMVAVMGYDPKDEGKYCKFYNEQTGGCFKGANCNKIHLKPLADGWTRDKVVTFQKNFNDINLPNIGQSLSIEMVCCTDIHIFYGHLSSEYQKNCGTAAMRAFNRNINRPENFKKYKMFHNESPAQGELVLAPYDGIYYRARVTAVAEKSVDVFFVDYGNSCEVYIDDLYKWNSSFNEIPFQAVKFQIAGIKPVKTERKDLRAAELYRHLVGRNLRGVVVDNVPDILIRLYTDNDAELINLLKMTEYCEKEDNLGFPAYDRPFFPA